MYQPSLNQLDDLSSEEINRELICKSGLDTFIFKILIKLDKLS